MADRELDTAMLHECVRRWRDGDRAAADELLSAAGDRLEYLARRMLSRFPAVRSEVETSDVLQGCLIRLVQALRTMRPTATRDFFNLAAVMIRRELLDLSKHFGPRQAALMPTGRETHELDQFATIDYGPGTSEDLETWTRFHQVVHALPPELCEVFGLTFYHGWTQQRIAELLDVDRRTVRRYWNAASLRVAEALGGQLPSF